MGTRRSKKEIFDNLKIIITVPDSFGNFEIRKSTEDGVEVVKTVTDFHSKVKQEMEILADNYFKEVLGLDYRNTDKRNKTAKFHIKMISREQEVPELFN